MGFLWPGREGKSREINWWDWCFLKGFHSHSHTAIGNGRMDSSWLVMRKLLSVCLFFEFLIKLLRDFNITVAVSESSPISNESS